MHNHYNASNLNKKTVAYMSVDALYEIILHYSIS